MVDFGTQGADVFVAFSEEVRAVYVDGEKVYEYDELPRHRFMMILAKETSGTIGSYDNAEAIFDHSTKEYIGSDFPEKLEDIVFSRDFDVIRIRDGDDLRNKLSTTPKDFVRIDIRNGAIDEKMVREYASDEIFDKAVSIS